MPLPFELSGNKSILIDSATFSSPASSSPSFVCATRSFAAWQNEIVTHGFSSILFTRFIHYRAYYKGKKK
jgi:hypothetical protein